METRFRRESDVSDPYRVVLVALMPRDETANAIGLAYLKSYADVHKDKTGDARIFIYEANIEEECEAIVRRILEFRPDFVAFQCLLCGETATVNAARGLHALRPDLPIALGGTEAGNRPEPLLRLTTANFVVVGEAEDTFVELLGTMSREEPIDGIVGLIIPKGPDTYVRTGTRPPPRNLEEIPSFYLVGEENPEEWGPIFKRWSEIGSLVIETSRGCPFNCAFCSWPKNVKPRDFPLERVRGELETMMRLDPTAKFHFADPDIFWDNKRAVQILPEIHRADPDETAQWWFNTYLGHMTEEMAKLCNHRGFVLEGAIQSTNPKALKTAHRRFSARGVAHGVGLIQKHAPKAWISLQLILGLPGDDRESFLQGLEWILQFGTAGVHVFPMQLMPGTEFEEKAKELGIVADPNPPYLVTATNSFPEEDVRYCRRVVLRLGLLRRHELAWKALRLAGGKEPIWARASSFTRFAGERFGMNFEEAVNNWEAQLNTYLTPITAGTDPFGIEHLEWAAIEWLEHRLPPEQFAALPPEFARRERPSTPCRPVQPTKAKTQVKPEMAPELMEWIQAHEKRFKRVIARRGGIRLGPDWRVIQARADFATVGALILTAESRDGEEMKLALAPKGADGRYMAASDRFQMSVLMDDEGRLGKSRELAVRVLAKQLGMQMASGGQDRPAQGAPPLDDGLPATSKPAEEAPVRGPWPLTVVGRRR